MRTDKLVKVANLQALTPLSNLPAEVLHKLSAITYFETEKSGVQICELGSNEPVSVYLLSGELVITTKEGFSKTLVGGSEAATAPVNYFKPAQINATAKSDIVFIRVQDAILKKAWGDQAPKAEEETGQLSDDVLIKRAMADLVRDYKANKLIIPSLPEIAIKIREAVKNPKTETEDVTRIIQLDPPLAARIVQVANSPIYRAGKVITNCRMAVSRLGLTNTRDLVLSCTLQQLFKSESSVLNEAMAELWRQSTLIGAISSIIARYARGLDEDRALLAGLVSNIGVLPIIAYIEKYPRLASNKAVLQQMTEAHATTVGTMVLQRWDFDKDMIAVVSETNNWLRDNKPEADYCDVVILAKYYVEADKAGEGNLPEINDIPAFRKISQGRLGESMGPKLLETARGEIEEIQKILQG